MDYDGLKYSDYWNQVTPENGTKWGTVEGTRGSYYWDGADPAFDYAKNHGFPFKFHTLIWGSQFPNWFKALSLSERYNAILNWMDVVKKKYPNLHMIDVANEAVEGHQDDTPVIKAALGGAGKTGYDWLIKAFEMAYERWPDAILIYNDFNTFTWQIDEYIELVRTLRDAGAPIDAYGNQAHDLGGKSTSDLQSVMKKQQDALKMPMYISEYDIQDANDANQKWNYQQHIPLMWEAEYCAGVTLWGWIYGHTWMENLSGIIKDKKERSALTWLREYMQTDAAKNAKSPYPGMKKEASIYIRPAALKVAANDVLPVKIHARLATKTIEKVDFYVNDNLVKTMTEAPYVVEHIANSPNWNTMKAVVTATDGTTYERYGRFQVAKGTKRTPYNGSAIEIPGTIKTSEFDKGLAGVVASSTTRSFPMSVQDGQWMEYTVDVKEAGLYTLEAEVASAKAGCSFHLAEYTLDNIKFLTEFTEVPNTGSTSEFRTVRCPITEYLTEGRHVLTFLVDNGGFYIKNMKFNLLPTSNLPGTVEAEDVLKSEGCSIVSTSDGFALGNFTTNSKAEYSVKVNQAGKYSYEATLSSDVAGSKFNMYLIDANGEEKSLGMVKVPNTGNKDVYQVRKGNISASFSEGLYTLRLVGTGGTCNIDNIKFICTEPTGINEVMDTDTSEAPAYNLMGVPVNAGYRGIVIKNGKKIFVK
jgi:GH35 family endo-1,4-beta-xylanase